MRNPGMKSISRIDRRVGPSGPMSGSPGPPAVNFGDLPLVLERNLPCFKGEEL